MQPAAATPEAATPAPGTERVWVPFYSERSANGFAERLHEAVHHPFRVTRDGPRRYQVVFDYQTHDERRELAERVRAVTGAP